MPSIYDELKLDSELVGLTAALGNLTAAVELKYREELARHDKKWLALEKTRETEEIFAGRCVNFLQTLRDIRGVPEQANEISACLFHPTYQSDFSNIFRRASLAGNVRSLPSYIAGKHLVDVVISTHLLETGWVEHRSIGAYSNAMRILGGFNLVEKFWVDHALGFPFVGRSYTYEKGLLDKTFKKLVHSIFIYEGYLSAKKFVLESIKPYDFIEIFSNEIEMGDPKTLLQEYFQGVGSKPPNYAFERDPSTSDHEPRFLVSTKIPGVGMVEVSSGSKKAGTQILAERAIQELKRNKDRSASINNFIATKVDSSRQIRKKYPPPLIPKNVLDLAKKLEADFGLHPESFRLLQALKTKSKGRSHFEAVPDNEVVSLIGAHLLEFSLVSAHPDSKSLGIEAVHPRICDLIVTRYSLNDMSTSIFQPLHEWGINAERKISQAVLFSMFVGQQDIFFKNMQTWLRTNHIFSEASDNRTDDRKLPQSFDANYSYATVLQEYVQRDSPVLPKYKKITHGLAHSAIHTAFCEFNGKTTKGTDKRYVWAKNAAAYQMLVELGYIKE